ncbi:hypothetical protein CALCODRAFT_509048 [Calocera cornea HHB12733]|uniref:Uncharacterized protein n=1 Tax=Calocera cornea HHB12733 TaxID=1353952 RepID=A0A165FR24_9BASI|nr:hypothetical protein CALCODRAFT_509048 [Calocera cornea HHB12733]
MRPLLAFTAALTLGLVAALPVSPTVPEHRDVLLNKIDARGLVDKRHKRKPPKIKVVGDTYQIEAEGTTYNIPVAVMDSVIDELEDHIQDDNLNSLPKNHESPRQFQGIERAAVQRAPFGEAMDEPEEDSGSDVGESDIDDVSESNSEDTNDVELDPSRFTVAEVDDLDDDFDDFADDGFIVAPPRPWVDRSVSNEAQELNAPKIPPTEASLSVSDQLSD